MSVRVNWFYYFVIQIYFLNVTLYHYSVYPLFGVHIIHYIYTQLILQSDHDDNRRPDILLRYPQGGWRQIILDVAVTGIDGNTRINDDKPDQPLNARFKLKIQKYEGVARQNSYTRRAWARGLGRLPVCTGT